MSQIIILNPDLSFKGKENKLVVHQKGLLHKGFSVILYDKEFDTILLQKRNKSKYHSCGLWTNSCCSHYTSPEYSIHEVKKRIHEELGLEIEIDSITPIGSYQYYAQFENELIENEHCDVFYSFFCSKKIVPFNCEEIEAVKWIPSNELINFYNQDKSKYTAWIGHVLEIFNTYKDKEINISKKVL